MKRVQRENVMELVNRIVRQYPNSYGDYSRSEIETMVDNWTMALEDYHDDEVLTAFKAFLVSDQKGFPPAIGQIVARIPKNPYKEESPRSDARSNRVVLKRSSDYFPGSIEVGDPHTGEIYYVKYEGYPYGEGDKGDTEESRVDAIKRWFRNLEENERNAWREHGAVFGEDLVKWREKHERGKKRVAKVDSERTPEPDGIGEGDTEVLRGDEVQDVCV